MTKSVYDESVGPFNRLSFPLKSRALSRPPWLCVTQRIKLSAVLVGSNSMPLIERVAPLLMVTTLNTTSVPCFPLRGDRLVVAHAAEDHRAVGVDGGRVDAVPGVHQHHGQRDERVAVDVRRAVRRVRSRDRRL